MALVSICVPVFKSERYIERCLNSIINQSEKDIEIIIVNDCTPDDSMRIVSKYASLDTRIRVFNHESNHGSMIARETAYKNACGKYLMFCDGDDSLPLDAVTTLLMVAKAEDSDIVVGKMGYIKKNGIDDNLFPAKLKYGNDVKAVLKSVLKWDIPHNMCGKLFKQSLFTSDIKNYEHAKNGEDGMVFYQLLQNAKKISVVDNVVYNYFQNESSASSKPSTQEALNSMLKFQEIRYGVVSKYPDLIKYLYACIIRELCEFKTWGLDIDYTQEYLKNLGIDMRLDLLSIIKYSRFKQLPMNLIMYFR